MLVTVIATPKKDRREYNRLWREKNREHCRETGSKRMAEWRAKNPDKGAAAQKRANRSPSHAARQRRYQEKHGPDAFYKIQRKSALKRRYNITPEQWDAMFAAQGSACANKACRSLDPGKCWNTDHCHKTGRVRAILCWSCNIAIGQMKDNAAALRGLADYLEIHSEGTSQC